MMHVGYRSDLLLTCRLPHERTHARRTRARARTHLHALLRAHKQVRARVRRACAHAHSDMRTLRSPSVIQVPPLIIDEGDTNEEERAHA